MKNLLAAFVLLLASVNVYFVEAFSVALSSYADTYAPPNLSNKVAIVTGASRGTKSYDSLQSSAMMNKCKSNSSFSDDCLEVLEKALHLN